MTESNSPAGDDNVERLVGQAYRPEPIDPTFVSRVHSRLEEVATEKRAARPQPQLNRRRLLAVAAGLAAVVALIVLPPVLWRPTVPGTQTAAVESAKDSPPRNWQQSTIRPRGPLPTLDIVKVGEEIRTAAGQRRRVRLPDDTVLSLNEDTSVRLDADRRLQLQRGEVFVEVAPRSTAARFVVRTPQRAVTALGTRFAVRAGADGTGVLVTQGKVEVSGVAGNLVAGQQLRPGAAEASAAERASHALAWTRDVLAQTEAPLIAPVRHGGGALVVAGPDGQQTNLHLRKYYVDVHVEDGFARTTIDQTYFNAHYGRLEGTFYFPLPADASLSRLAMYVDGTRMEGGMVERDYGRAVYQSIVDRQKDPALLEWVDGTTFKMRVFPLEGRQEKRIILCYTQKLPALYGRTTYRFPAGHSLEKVGEWSFQALVKGGAGLGWHSPSHALTASTEKMDLLLTASQHDIRIDRDIVLDLEERGPGQTGDAARFSSAVSEGARYLMVRYRPALLLPPQQGRTPRRDWVFLFEASAARNPLLARTQVEIIRNLLENVGHDDTFAVVTAGTRTNVLTPRPLKATPANVRKVLADLEQTHLIGALDLEKALAAAEPLLKAGGNPHLVHVGSGLPRLGERRSEMLAKKLPAAVYVGVGVGKRWNRALMKAAAERSGGYFTQINPDEVIAWRAFEVLSTLNTPRLLNVRVTDPGKRWTFLADVSALAQGEELYAVARSEDKDNRWPASVVVTGTLNGKPFRRELPLSRVATKADYLPRTWGRLEIDRLVAENPEQNRARIVTLSKALYVMSPFTSLLVLENEAMYQQFKVDRGRKDHWAPYPCPDKIPVVYEPQYGAPVSWRQSSVAGGRKPSAEQVLGTLIVRGWERSGTLTTRVQQMHFLAFSPDGKRLTVGSVDGAVRLWDATLSNVDEGLDPEVWTNYDTNRIEDVSVPGRVNLNAIIGIAGAPEGPPITIPPPPGSGRGQGAAPLTQVDFDPFGPDLPDGYRDLENVPGGFAGYSGATRERMQAINQLMAPSLDLQALSGLSTRERMQLRNRLIARSRYEIIGDGASDVSAVKTRQALLSDGSAVPLTLDNEFSYYPPSLAQVMRGHRGSRRLQARIDQQRVRVDSHLDAGRLLFRDLVGHAPGMNTMPADVLAVLDAEADLPRRSQAGRVAAAARTLIDRARAAGWEGVTVPACDRQESFAIVCDGQGRYRYERILDTGLREQVVCDGKTLLHLYPEIGLGARRTVSRFHRREFTALVPWLLPPVEDLARGADLEAVDAHTVAILPHAGKVCIHLVFAADGRLTERRLLDGNTHRLLERQTYSADGMVSRVDAAGKSRGAERLARQASAAPALKSDLGKLVVLSLPWRASPRDGLIVPVVKDLPVQARLATLFAAGDRKALQQLATRAGQAGDRRMGFYTLLAACGGLDDQRRRQMDPRSRLGDYLQQFREVKRGEEKEKNQAGVALPTDFLSRMKELCKLHESSTGREQFSRQHEERMLQYVRECRSPLLLWALVRAYGVEASGKSALRRRVLDEASRGLRDVPELACAARCAYARTLLLSGARNEARKVFEQLYREAQASQQLMLVDAVFRKALGGAWRGWMRRAAGHWLDSKRPLAALGVAAQCWAAGDVGLGDELLARVAAADMESTKRTLVVLKAVTLLSQSQRNLKAQQLLADLLAGDKAPLQAAVWRCAARLTQQNQGPAQALPYLERALQLEWENPPARFDLRLVRADYQNLLASYERLARAAADLGQKPPGGLLERVLRAAERWRLLDRDGPAAEKAADVLLLLGERELAWDYLTTWLGRAEESKEWRTAAERLQARQEYELADRALAAASSAEPTDAALLWERVRNWRQAGEPAKARPMLRRLAVEAWPSRFAPLQRQARAELGEP